MDLYTARAAAVAGVRERVSTHLVRRLADADAIVLSCASMLRNAENATAYILTGFAGKQALSKRAELSLTGSEWSSLIAGEIRPTDLRTVTENAEFRLTIEKIGSALKCTLGEQKQSALWASNWTRLLCYIAIHSTDADAKLQDILGTIVRADSRRLDDLIDTTDDEGYSPILMETALSRFARALM